MYNFITEVHQTPSCPHASGQSCGKAERTPDSGTWHTCQHRQARDRWTSRTKGASVVGSHISILGCYMSLSCRGSGRRMRGGRSGGYGYGRSSGGGVLLVVGLWGTVVLMVLLMLWVLLLTLLMLMLMLFVVMVVGGDGHGRDGWHHSSCYWEHWDSLRGDKQWIGWELGTVLPPGLKFWLEMDFSDVLDPLNYSEPHSKSPKVICYWYHQRYIVRKRFLKWIKIIVLVRDY